MSAVQVLLIIPIILCGYMSYIWKPFRYALPLALLLWALIILAGYGVGVLAGWW